MNAPQSEDYNNQGAIPWSREYIYFCLILNSHSPSLRQGRASTTTVPLPANNAGRGSEAAVEVAERQEHHCQAVGSGSDGLWAKCAGARAAVVYIKKVRSLLRPLVPESP